VLMWGVLVWRVCWCGVYMLVWVCVLAGVGVCWCLWVCGLLECEWVVLVCVCVCVCVCVWVWVWVWACVGVCVGGVRVCFLGHIC